MNGDAQLQRCSDWYVTRDINSPDTRWKMLSSEGRIPFNSLGFTAGADEQTTWGSALQHAVCLWKAFSFHIMHSGLLISFTASHLVRENECNCETEKKLQNLHVAESWQWAKKETHDSWLLQEINTCIARSDCWRKTASSGRTFCPKAGVSWSNRPKQDRGLLDFVTKSPTDGQSEAERWLKVR